MRGRVVDEKGTEDERGDRELEITRTVLAVYEARFGTPPAALAQALAQARDVAELTRWLSRVTRCSEAQLAAELRR